QRRPRALPALLRPPPLRRPPLRSPARRHREEPAAHPTRGSTGALEANGGGPEPGVRRRRRRVAGRLQHAHAPAPGEPPRAPAARARAPPAVPVPLKPEGWRIEIVDNPDRQQTQIMFGQASLPATHPDRFALAVAMSSFGGRGMKATLMDEVRTKRGLAYGAYMSLVPRRGPSALRGWVFTGSERTVTTLKLVLRLYKSFGKDGVPPERLAFFQSFV